MDQMCCPKHTYMVIMLYEPRTWVFLKAFRIKM